MSFLLLAASLVAVLGATSPPASADFESRWCTSVPAPCIESFTVAGLPQTTGLVLDSHDEFDGYREVNLELGELDVGTGDTLNVLINTGPGFIPDRMFGRMALQDVDTATSGGDHFIRIIGRPVRWADGCEADQPWPWPCDIHAPSESVVFGADIAMLDDRTETTIGMYAGTNAAFNGIFFDEQPDGTRALTTELVAPHTFSLSAGHEVITGSVRYRLSYRQMRLDMGIPNPETLVPGSLSGTINGGAGGGSFTTWHDPDGHGFFIQASGFTFSLKKIKVAAARINPTKPRITKTLRATSSRARVVHSYAKARGAEVTGYVARCSTSGGHTVQATGPADSTRIAVSGLRRGKAYYCRVAARSKAGPSAWSDRFRIAARP